MLTAVLSDIHSNLEALQSVLEDARRRKAGRFLFLGDAVGYGPNPNECVRLLSQLSAPMVMGNHDAAAVSMLDIDRFNRHARAVAIWTHETLSAENLSILAGLPLTAHIGDNELLLVHATPYEPEAWHYLGNAKSASAAVEYYTERICLIGHSHTPFLAEIGQSGRAVSHENSVIFKPDSRYVLNAGSVGQPRDGDPRASYILIDQEGASIVRVDYDIRETQRKMYGYELPEPLIRRLALGY